MNEIHYLSVTELNGLLNRTLEECLPEVWVEGELSEAKQYPSGHLYMTLKDATAQVRLVMWSRAVSQLKFKPAAGMTVRVYGRPNLFLKMGTLQISVFRMEQSGHGALQKRFLELKAKLEKEGLFAEARKRPIPFLPRAIGVVTSAQGAAIHDIMVRLKERMPQIPVYLVDVRVQGEGAAHEIAEGLRYLSNSGLVEVIITGRGGGSLEDLWAFNEEEVVRAVFACKVPVISAVGHEVDVSLCDLAADVRAPTPTAAAEIVVPRRADLLSQIAELERRLRDTDRWLSPRQQLVDQMAEALVRAAQMTIETALGRTRTAAARLQGIAPSRLLELKRTQLSRIAGRLQAAAQYRCQEARSRMQNAAAVLEACSPQRSFPRYRERTAALSQRLTSAAMRTLERHSLRCRGLNERLEAVSPQSVLERGFALVEASGIVVKSAQDLSDGQEIVVSFARDAAKAVVRERGLRTSLRAKS